jgi:hypothetical protein
MFLKELKCYLQPAPITGTDQERIKHFPVAWQASLCGRKMHNKAFNVYAHETTKLQRKTHGSTYWLASKKSTDHKLTQH